MSFAIDIKKYNSDDIFEVARSVLKRKIMNLKVWYWVSSQVLSKFRKLAKNTKIEKYETH